ncbi:MAG TPA: polysaccharide deacetylase family protein [Vicinamibacterales bacterium]|jgi:peptidoglycan/xylan/chitin deacetylase (PgdA/CDA1 family)
MTGRATTVCVTVDMEQDCPPYLNTWRGVTEGLPRLLELLAEEQVPATFFVTGELARRFPDAVRAILSAGHEVGSHGDTHANFGRIGSDAAREEIARSTMTLREFCDVSSFRAPYLTFPAGYVPMLEERGYRLDSSAARYKYPGASVVREGGVIRVPASVTSSTLRWPAWPRDLLLARLREPAVVFVHPWEFVDLTGERLRFDCRFKTGEPARDCLRETIRVLKRRAPRFVRMRDIETPR